MYYAYKFKCLTQFNIHTKFIKVFSYVANVTETSGKGKVMLQHPINFKFSISHPYSLKVLWPHPHLRIQPSVSILNPPLSSPSILFSAVPPLQIAWDSNFFLFHYTDKSIIFFPVHYLKKKKRKKKTWLNPQNHHLKSHKYLAEDGKSSFSRTSLNYWPKTKLILALCLYGDEKQWEDGY